MSDGADDLELVYDLGARAVSFDLHEELYAKEAVYGAAYLFVDRAYVFLTRPSDGHVRVRLRSRGAATEDQLVALAGEFANELLNQMVRRQVSEATSQIREYTLARAFFGNDGRASIDALLAELDAEDLDDDPLEIEVPWERSGQGSVGG
ncbi:MAG: His-Xaa-Ser system protein HxsD [Deltaproteobacteria bacterium]|nr:His-Xaa-Ser system protein HxsD [Deltaproteobacteria bacterium]